MRITQPGSFITFLIGIVIFGVVAIIAVEYSNYPNAIASETNSEILEIGRMKVREFDTIRGVHCIAISRSSPWGNTVALQCDFK